MSDSVLEKINKIAFSANIEIPKYVVDILPWGEITSVTPVFHKNPEDAIELNEVRLVPIKVYKCDNPKYVVPKDYKGIVGIQRSYIGYRAMSLIENSESLKSALLPLLNAAVKDVINNFGDISKYKLTFTAPGYPSDRIFRDVPNGAAFELRIFVIKE